MNRYDDIINGIIQWDTAADKLYAAIVVGSQARKEYCADEYSDLDIIMFVDDPGYFVISDHWIEHIGNPRISFCEDTFCEGKELRVLFDGALDVDFMFLNKNNIQNIFKNVEIAFILKRGYRILIDKIGIEPFILQTNIKNQSRCFISEQEFNNLANDFWYHTVWASKKLMRGEIWTAKYCVDTYMKSILLRIIECRANAINGLGYDTWHNGRFIEEWSEGWIVDKLRYCFSHYNKGDIKLALLSTMDLFRLLTVEVSEKLKYAYPKDVDEYATKWVANSLESL